MDKREWGNPLVRVKRELLEIEKELCKQYGLRRDELRNIAYAWGLLMATVGLKSGHSELLRTGYEKVLSMIRSELAGAGKAREAVIEKPS